MTNDKERVTADELNAIFILIATVNCFPEIQGKLSKRISSAKGTKRQIRLAEVMVHKVLDALLDTIPIEKLLSVKRMLPRLRHRIFFNGDAGISQKECLPIPAVMVDTLANKAHEACLFCTNDCNKCELGNAFDSIMAHTRRHNESWAYIDFGEDLTDLNSVKCKITKGKMV